MDKYGFVYIWRDHKHKRYYIGCHWGYETDGYICSSNWMRDAHRRRPHDFKRRILKLIFSSRKVLLIEEQRYLNMIKQEELGKRYYNLNNNGPKSEKIKKNMSNAHIGKKRKPFTDEHKAKIGETNKSKNRKLSEEHKRKLIESNKKRQISEETRQKLREARKGKTPSLGMKHTDEWKREHSVRMSGNNNPFFGKTHYKLQ